MVKQIAGLIPPIPTPFDENEELALDKFRENIQSWNQHAYAGYVVLGSNGEFVHLSDREKLKVVETAREAVPNDKLLIVGTGQNATRGTIEFIFRAASMRADAVLVGTPFYYRDLMKPPQLLAHFQRIADASPIPVLLYNVPQFTGVTFDAETVARLAEHPNIIGIKESSGNLALVAEILRLTPPEFTVLTGAAALLYPAIALGAKGGVLAVSSVAPKACFEIISLARSQDHLRGGELQLRLLPVARAVTTQFGIGGLKAGLEIVGLYGGPPRSPLPAADEKVKAQIRDIFRTSGLIAGLG